MCSVAVRFGCLSSVFHTLLKHRAGQEILQRAPANDTQCRDHGLASEGITCPAVMKNKSTPKWALLTSMRKLPLSLISPTSVFPSSRFFTMSHEVRCPIPPSVLPIPLSSERCHVPPHSAHGMNGLQLAGISLNHSLTHTNVVLVLLNYN